ncbi:MAG: hypothetical protein AB1634_18715, partial [Thermodesulfobacteriota bacterium]
LFGLAAWLGRRQLVGAPGTNAFVAAGVCLTLVGLPEVLGGVVWAVPIWSLMAAGLMAAARLWDSGGVRATSYGLQVAAVLAGTLGGAFVVPSRQPWAGLAAGAMVAVLALGHFSWCRRQPPPRTSACFGWLDNEDRSALAVLLAGLAGAFAAGRLGLALFLDPAAADFAGVFGCSQTILVNTGAILLLVLGARRRHGELLAVGVGLALAGALRVVALDLLRSHGLPLVASVFSFGVVAVVGSVALGRWLQGRGSRPAGQEISRPPEV